ncbi:alpha/beta hydrolase family protein [Rhizoctonia solani]|uniref:Alpha/beta hydrolase family protein n=1 Tax=Rhizoctonia solani TaxID=456999 RepID=A0A8H8P2S1_9AGAM|nr:alpha/beta hydrolase family protein [Rhizoctonia solani]QRW24160.1 alpha/beta hydrolase family protein [Rhizoctonia solani]
MRFYSVLIAQKSALPPTTARPWTVLYRSDSGFRRNHNLSRTSSTARALLPTFSFDLKSIRKFLGDGSVPVSALLAVSESSNAPSPWLVAGAVVGLPLALWIYKRKVLDDGSISTKDNLYGWYTNRKSLRRITRNAGNPLHRIPKLRLLVETLMGSFEREVKVVAVAPRSYWKSTKRSPSEAGFLSDYTAVLEWISTAYPHSPVVLYGHSIGGSIAVNLLGSLPTGSTSLASRVRGLVLENAFTSIPAMVRAVYPSKWLPYYYLGPLVFDKWDALSAIRQCGLSLSPPMAPSSALQNVILSSPSILIINSENDELVPSQMGEQMLDAASKVHQELSSPLGTGPRRVVIPGALHDGAFTKRQWREEIRAYIAGVAAIDSYRKCGFGKGTNEDRTLNLKSLAEEHHYF